MGKIPPRPSGPAGNLDTPKTEKGWRKHNAHYHRSKKGGGEWEFFDLPEQWTIHYNDLTFNLKPFSFKHTGLFPEQAANWDWFGDKIRKAGRPIKVLNLFAYTGGATLPAQRRRTGHTCGCFQRNGSVGKRKCCIFRTQ